MGRDGKPTRDKILAESKALIYENGFSGTSIDNILERTGITKGAFFYHFKTKADLAKVMIQEFAMADLKELEVVLDQTKSYEGDPKERLLRIIQHFIDMFSGLVEPPGCLYASVSNEQNQYSNEIKKIVEEALLKWRTELAIIIDQVKEQHPPRFPVDTTSLADQLTVVMEGAFVISKAMNDSSITKKHLIHLKQYFDLVFE